MAEEPMSGAPWAGPEREPMSATGYIHGPTGGAPIRMWTKGVDVEETARRQLVNVAMMPFIHRHLAVMPDVHWGMGATIGSVIPTKGAIIPAAVGVDIGCGMMAVRTTLRAEDLPDTLAHLRDAIEAAVPHGRTDNGGPNDRGAWGDVPGEIGALWAASLADDYGTITERHPKARANNTARHLGTLGTGNHFKHFHINYPSAGEAPRTSW